MTTKEIIDELFEFRTMLEGCGEDCFNCAFEGSCKKFTSGEPEYYLHVIDSAIEKLRETIGGK